MNVRKLDSDRLMLLYNSGLRVRVNSNRFLFTRITIFFNSSTTRVASLAPRLTQFSRIFCLRMCYYNEAPFVRERVGVRMNIYVGTAASRWGLLVQMTRHLWYECLYLIVGTCVLFVCAIYLLMLLRVLGCEWCEWLCETKLLHLLLFSCVSMSEWDEILFFLYREILKDFRPLCKGHGFDLRANPTGESVCSW